MRLRVLRKDAASECLDMKKQSIIVLEYILELDKQERSSNECLILISFLFSLTFLLQMEKKKGKRSKNKV